MALGAAANARPAVEALEIVLIIRTYISIQTRLQDKTFKWFILQTRICKQSFRFPLVDDILYGTHPIRGLKGSDTGCCHYYGIGSIFVSIVKNRRSQCSVSK